MIRASRSGAGGGGGDEEAMLIGDAIRCKRLFRLSLAQGSAYISSSSIPE